MNKFVTIDRPIPVPVTRYYKVNRPYEIIKYVKKPYIVKVDREVPVEVIKKIPVPQPVLKVESVEAEPQHIHVNELNGDYYGHDNHHNHHQNHHDIQHSHHSHHPYQSNHPHHADHQYHQHGPSLNIYLPPRINPNSNSNFHQPSKLYLPPNVHQNSGAWNNQWF